MVTIDEIPTWAHRAILVILYLNKGEISKQKLNELLYLIYKELNNKKFRSTNPIYIKPGIALKIVRIFIGYALNFLKLEQLVLLQTYL